MQPFALASLPARIALMLAAAALMTAGLVGLIDVAAADAKTKQGPKGGAFYKPPKQRPEGSRQGDLAARRDQARSRSTAPRSTRRSSTRRGARRATDRRLGLGQRPEGQAAEGRLAGDLLRPRHDRRRRLLRPDPGPRRAASSRPTSPTSTHSSRTGSTPATRSSRTDYQGLGTPGPHPYLVGEAEGRGVLDIVSAARQLEPSIGKQVPDRRPLAGRPVGAVRRRPGEVVGAEAEAQGHGLLRPGLPHLRAGQAAAGADHARAACRALAATIFEGASTSRPTSRSRTCSRPRRRRSTRRSTDLPGAALASPTASAAWRPPTCCSDGVDTARLRRHPQGG